ncbi:hypothetical protein QWY82_14600 [Simiduia curdlanivorans]|uniref:Uncharacterized protein n=1 Tax=Simiduia curdlanivorans TaxID=1492769 RepID=A0ABV8V1N4_9GAMM|nr:hypothetical protein [Simiduia curdlanivorans]MDN3640027.1 hypothetical protein [Simiduia curdlanivorans]
MEQNINLNLDLNQGQTAEAALASAADAHLPVQCAVVEQRLEQYYLPDAPAIALSVIAWLKSGKPVLVCIFDTSAPLLEPLPKNLFSQRAALLAWAKKNALACIALDQPLILSPVHIAKPWGEEIWFTGIEARGQSKVLDSAGLSVPLPWLLETFPQALTNSYSRDVILLKILAPLPEPVYGDLYFEMHEKKREVYVVTHVDQTAWPDAVGGIRFGFCQAKRAEFASDADFRAAYLTAVKCYERVRRKIDSIFDGFRQDLGIAINEPVNADTIKRWVARLPSELSQQELALRQALDAYATVKNLSVGDVVKVPCFTPHSLLHGVTTVEFQTPVYERKILSFAQKVLTQPHWDTESAMSDVSVEAPLEAPLPVLLNTEEVLREEVVRFDDFAVERITLSPYKSLHLDLGVEYSLLMAVRGDLNIDGCGQLPAMQARLLPAALSEVKLENAGADEVVFLYAYPLVR